MGFAHLKSETLTNISTVAMIMSYETPLADNRVSFPYITAKSTHYNIVPASVAFGNKLEATNIKFPSSFIPGDIKPIR